VTENHSDNPMSETQQQPATEERVPQSQHVLQKAGLSDLGWGNYYDRRLRLFACERPRTGED